MLPRTRRAGKEHFLTLKNKGILVHTPLFSIRKTPASPPQRPARFAVVVSVKSAQTAVARNRTKRRVYEAIRRVGALDRTGATYVVYAKREACTAPFGVILADLKEVFL